MRPEYLQRCTVLLLIYLSLNQNLHGQISPHMQYAIDAIWDNARKVHDEAERLRNQRVSRPNTYSPTSSTSRREKKYETPKPAYEPYKPLPKKEKSYAEILAEKAQRPISFSDSVYFYDSKYSQVISGKVMGFTTSDAFSIYVNQAFKYLVLVPPQSFFSYEYRVYFVGIWNG